MVCSERGQALEAQECNMGVVAREGRRSMVHRLLTMKEASPAMSQRPTPLPLITVVISSYSALGLVACEDDLRNFARQVISKSIADLKVQ